MLLKKIESVKNVIDLVEKFTTERGRDFDRDLFINNYIEFDKNSNTYVLLDGDIQVGFFIIEEQITFGLSGKQIKKLTLSYIYIEKDYRGKSLFSFMLKYIEDNLTKGYSSIKLNVSINNEAAISAYEKKGFVKKIYGMSKKLN